MAKDRSSLHSVRWSELSEIADLEFHKALVQLLDMTVAVYHHWHGRGAHRFLEGKPFSDGSRTRHVNADMLQRLGRKDRISFSKACALCALAGCNLTEFLDMVYEAVPVRRHETALDRNRRLFDAVRDLNLSKAKGRCSMQPPVFFIEVGTPRFVQALRDDGSDEAQVVIKLLEQRSTITSKEIESAWPELYKRVIKPILGQQTYLKISEPLFDPHFLQNFREALDGPLRQADEVVGFAQFVPCSLESIDFLRAHHRGLFERRFGDVANPEAWIRTYNELGESNAKNTRALLQRGSIRRFHHVMKESVLDKIVSASGEFKYVDAECLSHWRETLQELDREFGNRIRMILVSGTDEDIFEQRFGDADSMFFYTQSGRPLSGTRRGPDGSLEINLDPNQISSALALLAVVMAVGRSYTLGEFDRIIARKAA